MEKKLGRNSSISDIADTMVDAVFMGKPFEAPIIEIEQQAAQTRVDEIKGSMVGVGLTDDQVIQRADLIRWLETNQAMAALHQRQLPIFYRKTGKNPWSEGVFIGVDSKTLSIKVRVHDVSGKKVIENIDPELCQIATEAEREHSRVVAQLRSLDKSFQNLIKNFTNETKTFQKKVNELSIKLEETTAQNKHVTELLNEQRSQVSALLPKKKKEAK